MKDNGSPSMYASSPEDDNEDESFVAAGASESKDTPVYFKDSRSRRRIILLSIILFFTGVVNYMYFHEMACFRSNGYCGQTIKRMKRSFHEHMNKQNITFFRSAPDPATTATTATTTAIPNQEPEEPEQQQDEELDIEEPTIIDIPLDASSSPEIEEEEDVMSSFEGEFIEKKTFSNTSRILFVAGIRRGGHAVWNQALKSVCSAGKCKYLCKVSKKDLWQTYSIPIYTNMRDDVVDEFSKTKDGKKTVYIVNLFEPTRCGPKARNNTMSFPPTERGIHSFLFPNMQTIAALAEKANVDLRIVVLDQDYELVMRSWFLKLGAKDKQLKTVKVLEAQVHTMFTQLKQISRKFVLGYNMDTLTSLTKGTSLDAWTGLTGIQAALEKSAHQFHKERLDTPALSDFQRAYANEIKAGFALIRSLLSSQSPIQLLEKTPKDPDAPKIVFIAGLEGTGHHFWSSVVEALIKKKKLVAACGLEGMMYKQFRRASLWYNNKYMEPYFNSKARLVGELKKIKKKYPGKVVSSNLMDISGGVCNVWAGMLSYPNFGGGAKNLQRPNMFTLAEACEEAGVDLEVIVLLRNAHDIVISTIDNRDFGKGRLEGYEIKILESNANALYSELSAIDPKFVTGCVEYEDKELSAVKGIEERLGITDMEKYARSKIKVSSKSSRKQQQREVRIHQRQEYVQSLQNSLHLIKKERCPGQ